MARRPELLAVLLVALVVRSANVWLTARLPVAEYQLRWGESDMATAWEWSGRIVAGDLLCRDTVHQYTAWMRDIAPLATWERWWGGKGVYHQAPLHAYALAAMRAVAGDGFLAIALAQMLLGLASVALVFLLAERCFGRAAATLAGLGATLYGPFLLFETLVLRDTIGVTTSLVLLWALARAADGGAGRWLAAGLLFAVAVLARETTLALGPFVLLWIGQRAGWRPVPAAAMLGPFAVGAAAGFLPLVTRNLAVGVAPWALSTRGLETFVYGHAAGGSPVGLALPPAAQSILEGADGDAGAALRLTLASWNGDWAGLLGQELLRLRAMVAGYEAPDNASWYYFADRLPVLRCSLGFAPVVALGLVGLTVAERRADDRILRYFLLSAVIGLEFSMVIGRYRLPAAAVLLVYAGGALAWLGRQGVRGRWWPVVLTTAAAVALALVSAHALGATARRHRYRTAEYLLAGEHHYRHGDLARSLAELEDGLAHAYRGPDQRTLPPGYVTLIEPLVRIYQERGRPADAVPVLARLAADYPDDADLRALVAALSGAGG